MAYPDTLTSHLKMPWQKRSVVAHFIRIVTIHSVTHASPVCHGGPLVRPALVYGVLTIFARPEGASYSPRSIRAKARTAVQLTVVEC